MDDTAIQVKGIAKDFVLRHKRSNSVKSAFINVFKSKDSVEKQHVLKDISFEIKKGEFFGVVGRNGSGKSTLLKILAGIYQPTKGSVQVTGKLVSFIELGVGFNPELTGRENVYLNGAMLGFSRKEVDGMYDEIVDFAELERFMDQKLKNYSSGMQVRLAFSVAIKAKGDILVLDEVLAVGDEAFQRKCNDYFTQLKNNPTKTVILVTHGMNNIKKYCDRAMMIRNGEIIAIGDPSDVASEYNLENLNQSVDGKKVTADKKDESIIKDLKVTMLNQREVSQSDEVQVEIQYEVVKDYEMNTLVYLNEVNKNCYLIGGRSKNRLRKRGEIVIERLTFNLSQINNATIKIGVEIWHNQDIVAYIPHENLPTFMMVRTDYGDSKENNSILFGHGKWENG